jgi:hypothetical protein
MCRQQVQSLAVPTIDASKRCVANADCVLKHGGEHRPKITRRAANLKHLRSRRLLLQRFCEVGRAFGEVSCSLAKFVEQPRTFNGDDSLCSEVLDQFDLLVRKGRSSWRKMVIAPINSSPLIIGTHNSARAPSLRSAAERGSSCG